MKKLKPSYAQKLHPMGKEVWRPALTEEQKKQQEKDVKEGTLPF